MPVELNLKDLAPLTIAAILVFIVAQHFIKSFIERKIDQIAEREERKYEVALEMMRHQNQRRTLGYEVWINKVFETNVDLFSRLSALAQTLRTLEHEPGMLAHSKRDEAEQYLVSSYGESDELRQIMSFWHSNRDATLAEMEAFLRPIRVERARVATRQLEEAYEANQLFLSDNVLQSTSEIIQRSRAHLTNTADSPGEGGWFTDLLKQVRTEIIRALSNDHVPIREALETASMVPKKPLLSFFPQRKSTPAA